MRDLLPLVEALAGRARDGEQLEAYATWRRSTAVQAYEGEVESLEQAESAGIGVRVVVDGRVGFASAGSLDPDVVERVLEEARRNAAFATPDPDAGPAQPDGVVTPQLDLWREDLLCVPLDDKVELALELERAVRGADPRVSGVRMARYGDDVATTAVAATTGIRASSAFTSCHLYALALASEDGETQSGLGVGVGRSLGDLDLEAVAADSAERATCMLGAGKATSQRLTAVFEPRVAGQFLNVVGAMLSGEAVVKGRTPFGDRLGQPIASPILTLVDDPTDVRSLAASPADAEGLASRRTVLVEEGVLRSFAHNSWSSRKLGTASTASAVRDYNTTPGVGVRAAAVEPGHLSFEELLAEVGDGLLVRDVMGLHSGVNPVSGDFSVGVEGLMIRGGELAEPVREVTVASSIPRMLLDLVAVGADLEWLPDGIGTPSLAIAGISLSGT